MRDRKADCTKGGGAYCRAQRGAQADGALDSITGSLSEIMNGMQQMGGSTDEKGEVRV